MGKRSAASDTIDDLLAFIAGVGALGVIIVAPNGIQAIEQPLTRFLHGKDKRKEARRIGRYLQKNKVVKIIDNHDGTFQISLTQKGQARSARVQLEKLQVSQEPWDQKWRLFMFDIPEEHKATRDYLSRHMRHIGFKQLQKSVFVYPYPVDEFVELVRYTFPEVDKNISYMVVEDTDQHNHLVKQFKTIIK